MIVIAFFIPALVIALSVPLILGKIPPNNAYGLRTTRTLDSPEIWYPANRAAGWFMSGAGVLIIAVSLGLLGLAPEWTTTRIGSGAWVVYANAIPLGIAIAASFLYLRRLGAREAADPSDSAAGGASEGQTSRSGMQLAVPFLVPALMLPLAILLIVGAVPLNETVGFRTAATLADPDVWFPANRAAGWFLLIAAALSIGLSLTVLRRFPQWSASRKFSWMLGGGLVLPLMAALGSFLFLARL